MNDKRLKSVLFYGLTGIMLSILILLIFYNNYNYGIAALIIFILIIVLITSAVWISIFYWYIVRNKRIQWYIKKFYSSVSQKSWKPYSASAIWRCSCENRGRLLCNLTFEAVSQNSRPSTRFHTSLIFNKVNRSLSSLRF